MSKEKSVNTLGAWLGGDTTGVAALYEQHPRIERMAQALTKYDHEYLAWVTACLVDELDASERKLIAARVEAAKRHLADSNKLVKVYEEISELLEDPGLRGYLNVKAKLARDPKQAAKAEAFKLWQEWQAGKSRHVSVAAFARHVVATLPIIENTKTVERWVTRWRKDADAKRKKQVSS